MCKAGIVLETALRWWCLWNRAYEIRLKYFTMELIELDQEPLARNVQALALGASMI